VGRERRPGRAVHHARPAVRACHRPATVRRAGALARGAAAAQPRDAVNLASDNDIVGGNSGSPLLNSKGDIVGLIFDGNIHSISGAYWFDDAKNRAVAVDAAYIREALTKVYGATNLVEELSVGH